VDRIYRVLSLDNRGSVVPPVFKLCRKISSGSAEPMAEALVMELKSPLRGPLGRADDCLSYPLRS
jgi:hypothetical protein